MKNNHQIKAVVAGLLLSSSFVPVATAEDIEIYTSLGTASNSSNPNIMFIVDTSGSMSTTSEVKDPYDDSHPYPGSCVTSGIYFVDDGKIPDCASSTDYFDRSVLVCDHALVAYDADIYDADGVLVSKGKSNPAEDGSLIRIGTYSDQLAQWDTVKKKWRELRVGTSAERSFPVECFSDSGIHGASGGGNAFYIEDGGTGYTSTEPADLNVPHQVWSGGAGNLQLFNGNYINYLNDDTVPKNPKSYLDQVKSAVEIMVRGNTRVDIGLMQFDSKNESNGGAVQYPILDVGADRNDFFSRLETLTPKSYTPLSEVYYEALLYFGGRPADFSLLSNPSNQVVADTMLPGNKVFRSPISSTCDKNYIVLLSDGIPKKDDLNSTRQKVLPKFKVNSCSTDITSSTDDDNREPLEPVGNASTVDNCLDELSEWAFTEDVLDDDATNPASKGEQNIFTHTIGFQLDDLGAIQLMTSTAKSGGGEFYEAKSEAQLIEIFNKILANALQTNTTFSSPAVSVNAFNRSTHLDDLYFTLFKPSDGNHWSGNLKKYKLDFEKDPNDAAKIVPFIADASTPTPAHAVDENEGFFRDSAISYWTPGPLADGKEVTAGGAASVLTDSRNVVTFTGNYAGVASGVNEPDTKVLTKVDPGNAGLTDALLGTTGFPEIVAGTPYRKTLINWAAGRDALSQFGTANTYDDVRPEMGDPLHSEPALVQYGGTVSSPDLVIFAATNDGYLHAFDADTGMEEFAFIPQELLPNLVTAMENPGGKKLYGLDGSVAAWIKEDSGVKSVIDGSDHVYLYVSMRRGGKNIYALDVTNRSTPELLWVIKGGTGDYAELGESWSTINVEKIKDGGTEKTVLVFGGGYDPAQDGAVVRTADSQGRAVFIADATTGKRLWIGSDGGDTDVSEMDYSVPARVKPLDISGDGLMDRLYVADMGGQIFRFDIDNKNGLALSSSISGGRIADIAGSLPEDARRFYYPPDVALVEAPDGAYHALVGATGYRAHPLNETIHDRIYMLKDRNRGLLPASTDYATEYADLLAGKIHDATENIAGGDGADDVERDAELASIAGSEGWFIDLDDEDNPGSWIGEKGLSEALILEGEIILTTYTPNVEPSEDVCTPSLGLGKVFYLDIQDATPSYPVATDKRHERHVKLKFPGIPPSPSPVITEKGIAGCVGAKCDPLDIGLGVRKTYWYEVEK